MKLAFLIACVLSVQAVAQNGSTSASPPQPTTPDAQVRLGNEYLDKKDYSSAMIWFRKAAERNNPIAQNNIGWLYDNGLGVNKDYTEAMNWFRKSASIMPKLKITSAGSIKMDGELNKIMTKPCSGIARQRIRET